MTSWEAAQAGRSDEIAVASARRLAEQLADQSMTYNEYVWDLINSYAGEAA